VKAAAAVRSGDRPVFLPAALRFALALFPLWSTVVVLVLWTPWRQKIAVGSIAALTLASPLFGLLAIAVLTPLGAIAEWATELPYRLSEAWVLAFLGAWLSRAVTDRRGPRLPRLVTAAGWLLAFAALISVAAVAWRLRQYPGQLADLDAWLLQAYYVSPYHIGFVDAARIVEGLALVAAVLWIFRRRPSLAASLPVAIAIGGACAAAWSVAIRAGIGPPVLVRNVMRIGYRSAHVADFNAAGSYFAMVVVLSLGMAARARGRSRAAWAMMVAANAVGLWFSESRSAITASCIVVAVAAGWLLTARLTRQARLATVAALIVCGIAAAGVRAYMLQRDPTFHGAGFRSQFNETSLRMIAARPLGGIGIGQYYATSALFLTPQMAWTYGHENAHNYFLQIAAELGIPGALLFVAWTAGGLGVALRGAVPSSDPRLLGAAAGAGALVATCLTGHPLLIDEVAFPFWIVFGLAIGLAESARLNAAAAPTAADRLAARWIRPAAAVAAAAILMGAALSARKGPVAPRAERGIDGFYGWERAEDGRRFRWTEQYASLFFPADVRRIYIPVRLPVDRPSLVPVGLEIAVDGVSNGRTLVTSEWARVEVRLPDAYPPVPYNRVDLRVDKTWQPAIYIPGASDMRSVGVQVGECELVRAAE